MGLHPDFPTSPFKIAKPEIRWFPAEESLREKGAYEKLLAPFVVRLRKEVQEWRESDYAGVSDTTLSLLNFWFKTEHPIQDSHGKTFNYYFAQRESVETVIYLYEVKGCRAPQDLLKYDELSRVTPDMFEEHWFRVLTKQATGTGKTKVMSLLLVWSYFHKRYEEDSDLSTNFLVIAPNIIVLDRLRDDFDSLSIFFSDPALPSNGFDGRDWRTDFQPKLHIQDEVSTMSPYGNIFLTNIHRVYSRSEHETSFDDTDTTDYFLGSKPVANTSDNKISVGDIVRDIDELVVFNDEAHHIHDTKMAWFKSIQDIHNQLLQKGSKLSLQIDVTATPKHSNGNIFVQTVSDYPLVEAIHQRVVKTPILPDQASRAKLKVNQSTKFSEKYRDYLHLGVTEWKKTYEEHKKLGKKAVMFVMTDDTENANDVAKYLQMTYPELSGDATFTIHTKKNGEISEATSSKNEEELKELRKLANNIDSMESPVKAIVSVLMLKEGWDVQNVTTIVGLRPYTAKSNILPEQTLGRGLRRMYFGNDDIIEMVSVIGTEAFLEFVESIKSEGVELERKPMGLSTPPIAPVVITVDKDNPKKDMDELDIKIPILSARIERNYKNFSDLDPNKFSYKVVSLKTFSEEEQREIILRDIVEGEVKSITKLDTDYRPDASAICGHFTRSIMKDLRLHGSQDILYEKVKDFITNHLFGKTVDLSDTNVARNLSESVPIETIMRTFRKEINELTVRDEGEATLNEYINVGNTKPFAVLHSEKRIAPRKSVFNRIVGDSRFELEIANVIDNCPDVTAFVKNFMQIYFKMEYINHDGGISHYHPDFIVKLSNGDHWIIETKGAESMDDQLKIDRLKQWCIDATKQDDKKWNYIYLRYDDWEDLSSHPSTFEDIIQLFTND